jgi:hypothetical protein
MVNQQLLNYIKSAEAQGYTPQQLYNYLVQQGYNPKDVNEAMKLAGPQAAQPAPAAQKPASPQQQAAQQPRPQAGPGVKLNMDPKMLMITAITVLILGGAVVFVFLMPVCGNGELERGETIETCCLDAGCLGEQECINNICEEPICGACQYLEDHYCIDYECCQNNQCEQTQECKDHACVDLTCGECQYAENNKCNDYACCNNEQCNDDNAETVDICTSPGTKTAACSNIVGKSCTTDTECNDDDVSTTDTCESNICTNTPITACIDDDSYCPAGCTEENDTDCFSGDCGDDLDCFIEQMQTCTPATLNYTATLNVMGAIQNTTANHELQGMEGDRCIYYNKNIENTVIYSEERIQMLLDSGATQEEIDQQLQQMNDALDAVEGKDGTCKYPIPDLVEYFTNLKQGILSVDTEATTKYQCTGSLYGT